MEQQISLLVANNMENKLIKTFGSTLMLDGEVSYAFPTPEQLANASIEKLMRCGLSRRKAEYVQNISDSIREGKLNLEKFKDYGNSEQIIEELDRIRGIGVWTAELTVLRGMHKLGAMPAEDVGLRRAISHFYCNDRKITVERVRRIAEKWGKWKGLAGYYLIVAEFQTQI